jgi:Fe-S oxidoreductase
MGLYDPPRSVIKSIPGVELVEMYRIKEYAWCCGAGGGVREAYPDFSSWTARERIKEAQTTGATAIVTACPWCERNFIDALNESGDSLKVYDIVELVSQAM